MTNHTIRKEIGAFYWIIQIPWYHAPREVRLTTMLEF